jgi:nitrogen regulatory protein P-II 1
MKKVEAIIKSSKFENVKEALDKFDVHGLTVTQVYGCGRQKGKKEIYRGTQVFINLLPKIKIEIICHDESVDDIIDIICGQAKTGQIGDGKIFIYDVLDTVRIRTGERGIEAL